MKTSSILLALSLLLSACTSERAGDCRSDADCAALISSGKIDETHARCHPVARFCYPGCASDEDCDGWRFGLYCDPASGHCGHERPDGGAGDASDSGTDDAASENSASDAP